MLKDAGLPPIFSPHSFRVRVVTDLISQDVPLEDVQYLAGHANPRFTRIFDRRRRRVTRKIVERISVLAFKAFQGRLLQTFAQTGWSRKAPVAHILHS